MDEKIVAIAERLKGMREINSGCRIGPYKYPRVLEFVPELPKAISCKIRRTEIRQAGQAGKAIE